MPFARLSQDEFRTMKCISRSLGRVVAFVAVLVALGCGSGGTKLNLVPASGKITLDGAPMATGIVTFLPEDSNQKFSPTGIIENGTYKLTTDGKDGAPVGKYKVGVSPHSMGMGADAKMPEPGKQPKVSLNNKFMNPTTSGIVIEIVESPAAGAYDVKVTK
jgi:hypothetical protein